MAACVLDSATAGAMAIANLDALATDMDIFPCSSRNFTSTFRSRQVRPKRDGASIPAHFPYKLMELWGRVNTQIIWRKNEDIDAGLCQAMRRHGFNGKY